MCSVPTVMAFISFEISQFRIAAHSCELFLFNVSLTTNIVDGDRDGSQTVFSKHVYVSLEAKVASLQLSISSSLEQIIMDHLYQLVANQRSRNTSGRTRKAFEAGLKLILFSITDSSILLDLAFWLEGSPSSSRLCFKFGKG